MPTPTTGALRITNRTTPSRDLGQRPTTATGHPDNVPERRSRPTARLVGRDVRDRTSLRSPPPQLGILPHVRRVQRDDRHLYWRDGAPSPLATRRPTRRRKPSTEYDPTQDYSHTRRMGLRTNDKPGARRAIHGLMEIPSRRRRLHALQRRAQGGIGGTDVEVQGLFTRLLPHKQMANLTAPHATASSQTRCYDARQRTTSCTRTTSMT